MPVPIMTEGASDGLAMPQRTEKGAHSRYHRVVMTTCQTHGAAGFTNLLLTKEEGSSC